MPNDTMPEERRTKRRSRRMRWSAWTIATVTTITTLLSASLPAAAFIREWLSKDRELAVARAQQELATRSAYLDRALDPAKPAELRQGVLRFLVQTSEDERLRGWATEELKIVDRKADDLRGDLVKLQDLLARQQEELAAGLVALARERRARSLDARALSAAQTRIAELDRSRAEIESRISALQERLTGDKELPPFKAAWSGAEFFKNVPGNTGGKVGVTPSQPREPVSP